VRFDARGDQRSRVRGQAEAGIAGKIVCDPPYRPGRVLDHPDLSQVIDAVIGRRDKQSRSRRQPANSRHAVPSFGACRLHGARVGVYREQREFSEGFIVRCGRDDPPIG
jgi:hypothetical protein